MSSSGISDLSGNYGRFEKSSYLFFFRVFSRPSITSNFSLICLCKVKTVAFLAFGKIDFRASIAANPELLVTACGPIIACKFFDAANSSPTSFFISQQKLHQRYSCLHDNSMHGNGAAGLGKEILQKLHLLPILRRNPVHLNFAFLK